MHVQSRDWATTRGSGRGKSRHAVLVYARAQFFDAIPKLEHESSLMDPLMSVKQSGGSVYSFGSNLLTKAVGYYKR